MKSSLNQSPGFSVWAYLVIIEKHLDCAAMCFWMAVWNGAGWRDCMVAKGAVKCVGHLMTAVSVNI